MPLLRCFIFCLFYVKMFSADTLCWSSFGLMLGQRCRQWISIIPTLAHACWVCAVTITILETLKQFWELGQCWSTVYDANPAINQNCFSVLCLLGSYQLSFNLERRGGGERLFIASRLCGVLKISNFITFLYGNILEIYHLLHTESARNYLFPKDFRRLNSV